MSMFDYVKCEVPLPDGFQSNENFQTKDLECIGATHVIRKDGLYVDEGHYELVPKDQRRYPDAPEGSIQASCGCLKWVPKLVYQINFHGILNFYQSNKHDGWHEYNAKFADGKLIEIVAVKKNEGDK